MTREDQFIARLEAYLDVYDGPTPLPSAVRDFIRGAMPVTRQVGALPGPLRHLNLSLPIPASARYGLLAAVVVAAAVLGASLLGRDVGGPPDPTPTQVPTPLPVATPGALPVGPAALAAGDYTYANPYVDSDPLRSCDSGCSDYQEIVFTLPDGWATADGVVFKHRDEAAEVAFSVWTPGDIYLDPCQWQDGAVSQDEMDVLEALPAQAGRNGSTPTELTFEVTFDAEPWPDGQRAWRIDLSVPASLDVASCDLGQYRSWSEWDVRDGANSRHRPGQVDLVWVIDTDRRPLLIDASYMPQAVAADQAELEAIVASMVFHR